MKQLLVALAALGLVACGSSMPPPPPGTPLALHAVDQAGPRIPNGAIFAATDLVTLRSLIDATDSSMAEQFGGTAVRYVCTSPPSGCWSDVLYQPDRAYVALEGDAGFCVQDGTPQLALSGTHLELQLPYIQESGCHLNGTVAAPSAGLFWFPTGGLKPGLYTVSYVYQSTEDTYRSDSTYLSIPAPATGAAAEMDREATAALASVVGLRKSGLFSMSRVDGTQIAGLCGVTVAGPAYLVTYETDPGTTPRHMTVALAGTTPRTCATTRV
jgi:hypothetical protein